MPSSEEMEPLRLNSSLTITYPDKAIALLCPPRSAWKQLRQHFVELQSLWIELGFSTADLIADDRGWELMGAIAKLFPRQDNPAVTGFDIEPLQTDPAQLEELFLTRDRGEIYAYRADDALVINFYIDVFKGCKILEFCRFEPRMIVQDGHKLWLERQAKEEQGGGGAEEKAETVTPAEVTEITPVAKRRKAS